MAEIKVTKKLRNEKDVLVVDLEEILKPKVEFSTYAEDELYIYVERNYFPLYIDIELPDNYYIVLYFNFAEDVYKIESNSGSNLELNSYEINNSAFEKSMFIIGVTDQTLFEHIQDAITNNNLKVIEYRGFISNKQVEL